MSDLKMVFDGRQMVEVSINDVVIRLTDPRNPADHERLAKQAFEKGGRLIIERPESASQKTIREYAASNSGNRDGMISRLRSQSRGRR